MHVLCLRYISFFHLPIEYDMQVEHAHSAIMFILSKRPAKLLAYCQATIMMGVSIDISTTGLQSMRCGALIFVKVDASWMFGTDYCRSLDEHMGIVERYDFQAHTLLLILTFACVFS